MKSFHCNHCDQLIFFESVTCLRCGRRLAYLPDRQCVGALEPAANAWKHRASSGAETLYRLCENYTRYDICNWAVAVDDTHTQCQSCRLTQPGDQLRTDANQAAWFRLEAAKRRLVYTLLQLRLPLAAGTAGSAGLSFAFRADAPGAPALTGHTGGLVTINIAEADDAIREQRRAELHEPYRTLLGHFRHESGHFYWNRLIAEGQAENPRLTAFRALFGDERLDYGEALRHHYAAGPPSDWQQRFISAYASSHPWEDWAESWAHYLHTIDVIETAMSCGLELRPARADAPSLQATDESATDFQAILQAWFPLTYLMNNLNRSLGLADAYPFLLSTPAIEKLRFVHEIIRNAGDTGVSPAEATSPRDRPGQSRGQP